MSSLFRNPHSLPMLHPLYTLHCWEEGSRCTWVLGLISPHPSKAQFLTLPAPTCSIHSALRSSTAALHSLLSIHTRMCRISYNCEQSESQQHYLTAGRQSGSPWNSRSPFDFSAVWVLCRAINLSIGQCNHLSPGVMANILAEILGSSRTKILN